MKKNSLYIILALVVGLLAGYLLFGSNPDRAQQEASGDHIHANHSGLKETGIYTCVMHLQIQQSEPGDCPICGMELIRTEVGADGLAANEIRMTKNAMALANIQTRIVGASDYNDKESGGPTLSGKIMVNEDAMATMPAHFDGRVEKLHITSVGQEVYIGQKIATVYSPPLVAAQQELITASRLRNSQPALYKAVRNKFKNWKIHNKILDQIEASGEVITAFPIYSHVVGTVTEITINEGSHIRDGMPVLKVSDLSTVWAAFDVYENQISQFKKGQKITVTASAYADQVFDATVSFIDPILNTATRTVTVRATLKNTNRVLKPGMFVSGRIKGSSPNLSKNIAIPATALLWTGARSLVYVKTNPTEAIFEMREVILGNKVGAEYTITSGLQIGEEIVTNGTFTVDAAAQLQGKNSMMHTTETKTKLVSANATPLQKIKLPESFQKEFKESLQLYFQMKDAFVASDSNHVSAFAKATAERLTDIRTDDLGAIEKSHVVKSLELLGKIAEGVSLKNQRNYLVVLSENMIALATHINTPSTTWYVQKCPMANSNKGAVWLSTEKTIKNPYYGVSMLTCGSVIQMIE